jgi:hypothetical protein
VLSAAGYARASALALLGYPDEAINLADQVASQILGTTYPWLHQTWELHHADILLLCGRPKAASRRAARVLVDDYSKPLARGITGMFARWTARLYAPERDLLFLPAVTSVRSAAEDFERLDALDRFEVLQTVSTLDGIQTTLDTALVQLTKVLPSAAIEASYMMRKAI